MSIQTDSALASFEAELAAASMRGQWQDEPMLLRSVKRLPEIPRLWRYAQLREKLVEACEVLPNLTHSARRHLSLINPDLRLGITGSTHTLVFGMSMLQPGEIAWAHRHSMAAIRFVVEGDPNMVTVVDGAVCPMEDHDLILTPAMAWHDHENATDNHTVWVDVLDVPLAASLNVLFFEPYPGTTQPRDADGGPSSTYRFQWRNVERTLLTLAEEERSPYDGGVFDYLNPVTGGPTLPTMACRAQLLRPGEETLPHRHTSSAVFTVVKGEGSIVVEGKSLDWAENDSFILPSSAEHRFLAGGREPAILFSVSDEPVLRALGLYREGPTPA